MTSNYIFQSNQEITFHWIIFFYALIKSRPGWQKNTLQLNENKTEVLLLGPAATNNSIKTQLVFLSNNLHNHAKNLGVHFDPLLQFDKHVNAVVKSSFFISDQ